MGHSGLLNQFLIESRWQKSFLASEGEAKGRRIWVPEVHGALRLLIRLSFWIKKIPTSAIRAKLDSESTSMTHFENSFEIEQFNKKILNDVDFGLNLVTFGNHTLRCSTRAENIWIGLILKPQKH